MTTSDTKREAAHGLDRVTRFQGENATMSSPSLPASAVLSTPGTNIASIEAARVGPPPEVLEQIATAAAIEEQLRADGYQLRFHTATRGERTTIELADSTNECVRFLSVSEAVAIATGERVG